MPKLQQETLVQAFTLAGFVAQDHKEAFSAVIPYVFYGLRVVNGQHQYISLVSYQGEFCEAVWEVFLTKRLSRLPKGFQHRIQGITEAEALLERQKIGLVSVEIGLRRTQAELDSLLL